MARRTKESDKELFERFNAGLRKYLEDERRKLLERNPPIRKDDSMFSRRRPAPAPLRFQNQPNRLEEQAKRFDEGLRKYLASEGMRARTAKIQPKPMIAPRDEHLVKTREIRKKFDIALLNHLHNEYRSRPVLNSRVVGEVPELTPTEQLRRNLQKKYGDPRLNESSFSDFVRGLNKSIKGRPLSTSINNYGNYTPADLSEISLAPKYFVPRNPSIITSTPSKSGPKYSTSRISRTRRTPRSQRLKLSETPNLRLDEFFDIEIDPVLGTREQRRAKRFMEYNLPPMPTKLLKDLADFLNF